MKPIGIALLALSGLLLAYDASGQSCGPVRRVSYAASYSAPVSYQQQVYAPVTYQQPVYRQELLFYPVAVNVAANPDYYYSSANFYRDSLLADAIVGRLVAMQRVNLGGQAQTPAVQPHLTADYQQKQQPIIPMKGADFAPGPRAEARSAPTPVPPLVAKIVGESCIKCHGALKSEGGYVMDDLATMSKSARHAALFEVSVSLMPKVGAKLQDAEVQAFAEWAFAAREAGTAKK